MKESEGIAILIIFFIILSLLISLIYLLYFVNRKETSKILFIICFFYLSLFFFLHFVVTCDFFLNGILKGEVKDFNKFLNIYYSSFNYISYALKYLIFAFYSGYSKSGYVTTKRKIFDAIFYHYKILTTGVIFLFIGLIIFAIFKNKILDFYENGSLSFINYLSYLGLLEIYFNVGFFFIHLIPDFKIYNNSDIALKYLNFIIVKLDPTENNKKYLEALGMLTFAKVYFTLDKLTSKNLKETLKSIAPQLGNDINDNQNNEPPKEFNELSSNEKESYNYDIKLENSDQNKSDKDDVKLENSNNNESENDNVKSENPFNFKLIDKKDSYMIEKEISEYVRTLKSRNRRREKLNYLVEVVERQLDFFQNKENEKGLFKCYLRLKYSILFLALVFIFNSELACSLSSSDIEPYSNNKTNTSVNYSFYDFSNLYLKNNITLENELNLKNYRRLEEEKEEEEDEEVNIKNFFIILIFGIIFILFNSSYTIALLFSLYKRKLISGDFFYARNTGDNLNLIETVKTIGGVAFPLVYCNWYLMYFIIGRRNIYVYEFMKIPEIKAGNFNLMPLIRFILIILSGIITISTDSIFSYPINDFSGFDKIALTSK